MKIAFRPFILAAFSLLFFCADYAAAGEADYLELSLEELLDVKITGATLRAQDIHQIPASVNTFSAKSIQLLGVKTLHELIRFVPGFQEYRADDSNNSNIVTRGKTVGNSSREILLLVDGVRVDNWFDGGSAGLGRIPLYNVERIEFIRGPVSQVYGANAFQGVINVITQNNKKGINVGFGSHHARQLSGSYSHAGEIAQQTISLDYYKDEGENYTVIDPFDANNEVNIYDEIESLYANYKFLVSDWMFSALYKNNRSEGFYDVGGYHPDFTDFQFEYNSANARHEKQWNESLQTRINIGAKAYDSFRKIAIVGEGMLAGISEPPSNEGVNSFLNVDGEGYWFNADLLYNQDDHWIYQMGLEYRYDDLANVYLNNNFNVEQLANADFPVDYYGNFENKTLIIQGGNDNTQGVFGQVTYASSRNELTFGLRNDHSPLAGSNVSPKISAIHFLNQANSIKLIYGEAFRVPGANEYYLTNNPVVNGNPDLEAETVATSEFIWLYDDKEQRLQLSVYENRFDGTIVQGQPDGERHYTNSGKSSNRGAELTFVYPLSDSWVFRTSYSKIFDMLPEAFRLSDTQANIFLQYHRNHWNIAMDCEYVSERSYIHTGEVTPRPIEPYGLGNLYVAYTLSAATTLSFNIRNLGNEETFAPSTGDSQSAIPARRRYVMLNLDWKI